MKSRVSDLNIFRGRKLKKTTVRFAFWSTAILAVFFLVILVSFHLMMNHNIRHRSEEALESLAQEYRENNMDLEGQDFYPDQTEEDTGMMPETAMSEETDMTAETDAALWQSSEAGYIPQQESESESLYEEDESSLYAISFLVDENYQTEFFVSAHEKKIASWCRSHPFPDETIHEAKVGKRIYYVFRMKDRYFSEENQYRWILYVDITAQRYLISQVERVELFIMIICALAAMYLGILFGISLEAEQEKQKQFFENASHELKTPLMSIQGYAEGIESGVITDTKKASRIILSETDKMRDLVEEILSLSRLESRQTKLSFETVEISEVVNNCLMSLEYVIRKRGLDVSMNLDETKVAADPDQFERVVINLISNAVKYAATRITITCGKGRLAIQNDGCLLSQEDLEHIFDRFYIGEHGSTGIGLALAKEIVEKHGWKIFCENGPGGVSFIILF